MDLTLLSNLRYLLAQIQRSMIHIINDMFPKHLLVQFPQEKLCLARSMHNNFLQETANILKVNNFHLINIKSCKAAKNKDLAILKADGESPHATVRYFFCNMQLATKLLIITVKCDTA